VSKLCRNFAQTLGLLHSGCDLTGHFICWAVHFFECFSFAFATARRASKLKGADSFIEVFFDSFLQPALAGVRAARTGMRRVLYRADPHQVDLQIELKTEGNRLAITGQLLEVSRPDIAASQVQVTISNRRGSLLHTLTNQFGKFGGEIENSGDLEISFPRPGENPVVILLRNALDGLPEE